MPHSLPLLAGVAAAPLFALAVHAAPTRTAAPAAPSALPNNLCASCHGPGKPSTQAVRAALDARDLAAARLYLNAAPQG